MVKIAIAGNSETAAYAVLWELGYELGGVRYSENTGLVAKKGNDEFLGESAIEILGLIAMLQARGKNWKPTEEEVDRVTKFENEELGSGADP